MFSSKNNFDFDFNSFSLSKFLTSIPGPITERNMRKCKVFVGSSHPELGNQICQNLGISPSPCTLKTFSNGETSVQLGVSVRDEDVYVIQSSSSDVNNHIMELLILISAFKSGSAAKITAVIPHFPYSKQSKMKKHRGAISARLLANLLIMAGANHIISMDLHASQMQGFFHCPVDNLYPGPTLGEWIRNNLEGFDNGEGVIVSKNPGGTKRVTALADSLGANFAMIHTDKRRTGTDNNHKEVKVNEFAIELEKIAATKSLRTLKTAARRRSSSHHRENINLEFDDDDEDNSFMNDFKTARIIKGHVVEDSFPSPEVSEDEEYDENDQTNTMIDNVMNTGAGHMHGFPLGGTGDAAGSDDEDDEDEDETGLKESFSTIVIGDDNNTTSINSTPLHKTKKRQHSQKLITLVGNVKNKPVIILDDIINKPGSFISAAEHCKLICGASSVTIIATHGVFTKQYLERLNDCEYIDRIIVTNTYPISNEATNLCEKLIVIDVSYIFAECIRRDHHGESISALFERGGVGLTVRS